MVWNISFMEWNCMEDFACYVRWKTYIPFHSMPWPGATAWLDAPLQNSKIEECEKYGHLK